MCKSCGVIHCAESERMYSDFEHILTALRTVLPWANYAQKGFTRNIRIMNAIEFLNGVVRAHSEVRKDGNGHDTRRDDSESLGSS
jgi:hypothetical protein